MSEIRDTLVETARERAMITYSDPVSQVDAVSFNAFDQRLFAILGQLSVAEHEAGRPLLSVLVVHKHGDMKPGEGFFRARRGSRSEYVRRAEGVDFGSAEGLPALEQ